LHVKKLISNSACVNLSSGIVSSVLLVLYTVALRKGWTSNPASAV